MDAPKAATLLFAVGIKASAALVIGLATIEATFRSLVLFILRPPAPGAPDAKDALRLRLGRWQAVALELELGADILRTAGEAMRVRACISTIESGFRAGFPSALG